MKCKMTQTLYLRLRTEKIKYTNQGNIEQLFQNIKLHHIYFLTLMTCLATANPRCL
jgi:hypothetical protein